MAGTGPDGKLPGGPVVIWDPVGGPIGVSAAELLAPGRQVDLVTPDLIAGTQLARSGDLPTRAPGCSRPEWRCTSGPGWSR
jgi:hypothetical protein